MKKKDLEALFWLALYAGLVFSAYYLGKKIGFMEGQIYLINQLI